jgi:DNA mismatch repair protein MutS
MDQYREIKAQHPECVLLFRMGDFYELFEGDALLASKVLGITLTSRSHTGHGNVPLAGVPARSLPEHLPKLVAAGHRVAVCEQLEDGPSAKGLVRRAVVETVTPGATFSDSLLSAAANNFLCAIAGAPGGDSVLVALLDLSTGEFRLRRDPVTDIQTVLGRYGPREVVATLASLPPAVAAWVASEGALLTQRDAWEFDVTSGADELCRRYALRSLDVLGLDGADRSLCAVAGALLRYVQTLQPLGLPHLQRPVIEHAAGVMPVDEMTRRNLELVEPLRAGDTKSTLLYTLDCTATAMGARLLRQWLLAPLTDRAMIEPRHDAVGALLSAPAHRTALRSLLGEVRDLERLGAKAAAGRATPREVGAIVRSLALLPALVRIVGQVAVDGAPQGRLVVAATPWLDLEALCTTTCRMLVDAPPAAIGDEPSIRDGADATLDRLRGIQSGGADAISTIEREERVRTGIATLKVGFHRIHGYFIEISNTHRDKVPADYQRRQTLAGAERYVTPALKVHEEAVLGAAGEIEQRERELFEQVRHTVGAAVGRLQTVAAALAELDVLLVFADHAERWGYVRPTMVDSPLIAITAGRHPVLERIMPRDRFIPNDVSLTPESRLVVLTGPNMAGKSTVLRQTGLIVLMAQIGSFVPASHATLGVVDRVYTRVGASDNLVRGQSTFMVEMAETSAILHGATSRSLVLLDEIGRGTSTYDGLSIAWSVAEHLYETTRCATLFATHYHELVTLAEQLPCARNEHVAVAEALGDIAFLHRLAPGGATRSYGIAVGRLAGLPTAVTTRAQAVLVLLEQGRLPSDTPRTSQTATPVVSVVDPLRTDLQAIDPERMTPLAALAMLGELAAKAKRPVS